MHEQPYREKKDSDNESENNDSGFSNLSASTTIEQQVVPSNTNVQETDQLTPPVLENFASLRIGTNSPTHIRTQVASTTHRRVASSSKNTTHQYNAQSSAKINNQIHNPRSIENEDSSHQIIMNDMQLDNNGIIIPGNRNAPEDQNIHANIQPAI